MEFDPNLGALDVEVKWAIVRHRRDVTSDTVTGGSAFGGNALDEDTFGRELACGTRRDM